MAIKYTKTNWVNNVTKLNATNMNHIEDGIEVACNKLDDIPISGGENGSLVCNSENIATGDFAMAINGGTFSYKNIVVNAQTEAKGTSSYASGQGTKTAITENGLDNGVAAHAEGSMAATSTMPTGYEDRYDFIQDSYYISGNYAGGRGSHVEGCGTKVRDGKTSGHAEGYRTIVDANNAHAEGFYTTAAGENGHAEGAYTYANGAHSHAEGYMTQANGDRSHSEGRECKTLGANAHAEGYATSAKHTGAHTEGSGTVSGDSYQHTAGKYNVQATGARVTGGGTEDKKRKNIEVLDWNGNLTLAGSVKLPNGTITGISDSKGTSTTITASQKCLNDNYLPLSGGTITGDLTANDIDGHTVTLRPLTSTGAPLSIYGNGLSRCEIAATKIRMGDGESIGVNLSLTDLKYLSFRIYTHRYKFVQGSNILIAVNDLDDAALRTNFTNLKIVDGQIGYLYNGTATEPVLLKIRAADNAVQCFNFAEQEIVIFEADTTTFTDTLLNHGLWA